VSGRVRRFFFVRSPGRCLHRLYKTRYSPVEGDRTACGIAVTTTWSWVNRCKLPRVKLCRKCENAAG